MILNPMLVCILPRMVIDMTLLVKTTVDGDNVLIVAEYSKKMTKIVPSSQAKEASDALKHELQRDIQEDPVLCVP